MGKSILGLFIWLITLFIAFPTYAKDPLNIGVVLWRGPTDADQTFISEVKKTFPDAVIHQFNSNQNIRKSVRIIEVVWKDQLSEMDYLFTFGSRNSIQIRKSLDRDIFKGIHIAFGNASILSNAFQQRATSKEKLLLAQTSLPDDALFTTYQQLLQFKKIGIPFNLREPQNSDLLEIISTIGKQRGVEIVPIRTRPDADALKNQIKKAIQQHKNIDALYYPLDSFLLSNISLLNQISIETGVIGIGSNKKYMKEGTPLGLDSDYVLLGKKLAQQLFSLENGDSLLAQKIVKNNTGRMIINYKTLKAQAPELLNKLPSNIVTID